MSLSPEPFTLRQLVDMSAGQRERDWETVSHLMALIANVNNTKRGKSYSPLQFNPTVKDKKNRAKVLPYSRETMDMAKAFFKSMAKR